MLLSGGVGLFIGSSTFYPPARPNLSVAEMPLNAQASCRKSFSQPPLIREVTLIRRTDLTFTTAWPTAGLAWHRSISRITSRRGSRDQPEAKCGRFQPLTPDDPGS